MPEVGAALEAATWQARLFPCTAHMVHIACLCALYSCMLSKAALCQLSGYCCSQ